LASGSGGDSVPAEFFNGFNHPQFANRDTTTFESPTFGVIDSTAVKSSHFCQHLEKALATADLVIALGKAWKRSLEAWQF
jgi:hypothetical protein